MTTPLKATFSFMFPVKWTRKQGAIFCETFFVVVDILIAKKIYIPLTNHHSSFKTTITRFLKTVFKEGFHCIDIKYTHIHTHQNDFFFKQRKERKTKYKRKMREKQKKKKVLASDLSIGRKHASHQNGEAAKEQAGQACKTGCQWSTKILYTKVVQSTPKREGRYSLITGWVAHSKDYLSLSLY